MSCKKVFIDIFRKKNNNVDVKLQRIPGESDDDFLTRRDKIRAKAGTLGGIPNRHPISRGARNSTEVRSGYSDMISNAKLGKNESVELDEGSIANIKQKLKDHAQRKINHEAKFG